MVARAMPFEQHTLRAVQSARQSMLSSLCVSDKSIHDSVARDACTIPERLLLVHASRARVRSCSARARCQRSEANAGECRAPTEVHAAQIHAASCQHLDPQVRDWTGPQQGEAGEVAPCC